MLTTSGQEQHRGVRVGGINVNGEGKGKSGPATLDWPGEVETMKRNFERKLEDIKVRSLTALDLL